MKRHPSIFIVILGLTLLGCQAKQPAPAVVAPATNTSTTNALPANTDKDKDKNTNTVANTDEYVVTKTGKKILKAEQGISIHFDNGWTKEDMAFHLDYCKQMMAGLKDKIDADKFCPCFLDKIQYYYEPIYFKEAYTDQKHWNEICYQNAMY